MKERTGSTLTILGLLVSLCMVVAAGCGSSGQAVRDTEPAGDVENIDALLGLTGDSSDKETQKEETMAEDDVLKLLGVTETAAAETADRKAEERLAERTSADAGTETRETAAVRETAEQGTDYRRAEADTREVPASRIDTGRDRRTYQERYQEALGVYKQKQYRPAIQMFEALLSEDMNHPLSDNCQYWIGECYDGLGDYQQAAVAFEKVFTFYKANKEPDAQLKLGIVYMRMKDYSRASLELQKLIDNYPSSQYVSVAKQYLARIK